MFHFLFTLSYSLLSDTKTPVIPSVPERSEGREGPQVFLGREVASSRVPRRRVADREDLRSLATLAGPLDYARGMARVARDDKVVHLRPPSTSS